MATNDWVHLSWGYDMRHMTFEIFAGVVAFQFDAYLWIFSSLDLNSPLKCILWGLKQLNVLCFCLWAWRTPREPIYTSLIHISLTNVMFMKRFPKNYRYDEKDCPFLCCELEWSVRDDVNLSSLECRKGFISAQDQVSIIKPIFGWNETLPSHTNDKFIDCNCYVIVFSE